MSNVLSLGGLRVDGSPVVLGSTATHDPIVVTKALWARWKSLDATNEYKLMGMSIQGQTTVLEVYKFVINYVVEVSVKAMKILTRHGNQAFFEE